MKITKTELREIIREQIQKLNEVGDDFEAAYQDDLDKDATIVVIGEKPCNCKPTPFEKKFKNYKEAEKWMSANYRKYDFQYVENE